MSGWRVELVAHAPDEHTAGVWRAEVLKLAALYGVTLTGIHSHPHPFLRALPGGKSDPKGAA